MNISSISPILFNLFEKFNFGVSFGGLKFNFAFVWKFEENKKRSTHLGILGWFLFWRSRNIFKDTLSFNSYCSLFFIYLIFFSFYGSLPKCEINVRRITEIKALAQHQKKLNTKRTKITRNHFSSKIFQSGLTYRHKV